MNSFGQLLAFGAGAMFLGVTFMFYLFAAIASHRAQLEEGEGCLVTFICLAGLSLSAVFFVLALGV